MEWAGAKRQISPTGESTHKRSAWRLFLAGLPNFPGDSWILKFSEVEDE